jgi:hypothetical protein
MKRKIAYTILFTFLGFSLFQSCDKIEGPYRESTDSSVVISLNDSNSIVINGDTILFPNDTTTILKKVLAEDYTGHLCPNCPDAGVLLNDTIKNIYHDKLVVVSVHAGFFASPCPGGAACPGSAAPAGSFATDFRATIGTAWNTFFTISGNPKGMIDRVDYPTHQHGKSPSSWASFIQAESLLPADFKIRIMNHYDPSSHVLHSAVQSKFLANKTGDFKLLVVLTEDSIADWQEWLNHVPEYVPDFVHHHVLRDAITTGTWGVDLDSGSVASGTVKMNGFSHSINSAWNANHCKVVAFIYDPADYKVLQVEEVNVIQ